MIEPDSTLIHMDENKKSKFQIGPGLTKTHSSTMDRKKSPQLLVPLIVVLLLAAGATAYFSGWISFPTSTPKPEETEVSTAPTPTPPPEPDSDTVLWEKVTAVVAEGDRSASRAALLTFIRENPAHPEVWTAKQTLGQIHSEMLFGSDAFPGKTQYTVVQGDTLSRISAREKTTIEFLMVANQLQNPNIGIGQQLSVIPSDFSVTIDMPNRCVMLNHGEEFFRFYPIIKSSGIPAGDTPVEGEVTRKMTWAGTTQVPPGSQKHLDAARWIGTSAAGITVYGPHRAPAIDASTSPEETPAAVPQNPPPGPHVEVSQQAALEISALAGSGSPVVFIPAP